MSKELDFYLPTWKTSDGSIICVERCFAHTEQNALREGRKLADLMRVTFGLLLTGNVYKVKEEKLQLIRIGKLECFVVSGPLLDEIDALASHPDVSEGIEQPLRRR